MARIESSTIQNEQSFSFSALVCTVSAYFDGFDGDIVIEVFDRGWIQIYSQNFSFSEVMGIRDINKKYRFRAINGSTGSVSCVVSHP